MEPNKTFFIILSIFVLVAGLSVLFSFLRKQERRNTVLTVDESSIPWKEVECVTCGNVMKKGYAFAGRGINWVPKHEKKPGAFSTVGSVLENTYSLRIPPALNMAWYCESCKILVFDNSKMLKIKNVR